jgi:lipoyl(octanoyl) transferase
MKPQVEYQDLGLMRYQTAWDYQTELNKYLVQKKLDLRDKKQDYTPPEKHYLLFCEHPHVYTLGRSGSTENLLLSEAQLTEQNIEFYKINRGGDITYHGLGQIVGYPILDLDAFFNDVHRYVRHIEEMVIRTLQDFGLTGYRISEYTGVWLGDGVSSKRRKICAIGVHLSRWVTLHGFALNVNADLKYFDNIIPCGIVDEDKTVTSMQQELGEMVSMELVKQRLCFHFQDIFECELV